MIAHSISGEKGFSPSDTITAWRDYTAPDYLARGTLFSETRPIANVTPAQFLKGAAGSSRIFWQAGNGAAYAGSGSALTLRASGTDRFRTIDDEIRTVFAHSVVIGDVPQASRPRFFGGFSFSPAFRPSGIWMTFAPALFILPAYTLTQIGKERWLTVNRFAVDSDEGWGAIDETFETIAEWLGAMEDSGENTPPHPLRLYAPQSRADWGRAIGEVKGRMRAGELEKVVLARMSEVSFDQPVDPARALDTLSARYPETYRFLIEPEGGHAFFGATPELLVETNGVQLHTMALAGSARRGETNDEDAALGAALLASAKDRFEHIIVVDALRNTLTSYTETLDVPAIPTLLRLSNIQHLYTPISGTMRNAYGALRMVKRLHPTPALGGAPRDRAMEAIEGLETFSRGWYAAPVGWVNEHGDGAFAVAIRSAVSAGERARLYAGVGIVSESDAEREWEETKLKLKPMLHALGVENIPMEEDA